ncbi:flagellar assembly protein T N-terminal domain-containing protein [Gayadomonas joobiniege]|uniref:flagellar assembly protein T N-terminal domain-containing protein n=1 Tax=Gayadomonas joobiniege TaxID=1234606 RepID=UPI00037CE78D|nr:flagellar assembly protein T N-terminal domain-containing protein [Gayadomonas joobiniege]
MRILLFLSLIFNSQFVCATWYQSSGSGWINQGNVQAARKQAIEEALQTAVLQSGATISSSQQVSNGQLTHDEFHVRSTAIVNQVQILAESTQGNRYSVQLKAEIFSDQRQCISSDYRKTLSFLPFTINHPRHAQVGALYQLGESLAESFTDHAQQSSQHFIVQPSLPITVNLTSQTSRSEQHRAQLQSLGEQSQSQFLVWGQIKDISLGERPNQFSSWFSGAAPTRYLVLQLNLYDAIQGQHVKRLNYQDQAQWTFPLEQRIDPYSRQFWVSEYGQMLNQKIQRAIAEIDNYMACAASYGQVIRQQNNEITMDMGQQNGVRLGDVFVLYHQQTFADRQGRSYQQLIRSDLKLTVTQTSAYTSTLTGEQKSLLLNIQAGDLLLPAMQDTNVFSNNK